MQLIAKQASVDDRRGMNGAFNIMAPLGVVLTFAGAPFRQAELLDGDAFKVKCATEQPGGYDAKIDCVDFGVPTHDAMRAGVDAAITAAFEGRPVFAGCAGGIGRTGTFMAVVLKVLTGNNDAKSLVEVTRHIYLRHAIETLEQINLIKTIDVTKLRRKVKWLWARAALRRMLGGKR